MQYTITIHMIYVYKNDYISFYIAEKFNNLVLRQGVLHPRLVFTLTVINDVVLTFYDFSFGFFICE